MTVAQEQTEHGAGGLSRRGLMGLAVGAGAAGLAILSLIHI